MAKKKIAPKKKVKNKLIRKPRKPRIIISFTPHSDPEKKDVFNIELKYINKPTSLQLQHASYTLLGKSIGKVEKDFLSIASAGFMGSLAGMAFAKMTANTIERVIKRRSEKNKK